MSCFVASRGWGSNSLNAAILVVGEEEQNGVCANEWVGVVRREDIRETERDKVKVQENVKVGDLLRGELVGLVEFLWERHKGERRKHKHKFKTGEDRLLIRWYTWISLGDQSNYYLTMARNELGVIMATNEAGNIMFPISWNDFRDPIMGLTESRKVAKPF